MKKSDVYKKGINDASDVYREKYGTLREDISRVQKNKIVLIREITWFKVN